MVPQRPFLIGRPGCVRSSAWIWLFSSTHSTIACCGGLRYKPTTTVNFARNLACREDVNFLIRWGLELLLRQMLLTIDFVNMRTPGANHQAQPLMPLAFE